MLLALRCLEGNLAGLHHGDELACLDGFVSDCADVRLHGGTRRALHLSENDDEIARSAHSARLDFVFGYVCGHGV